MTTLVDGLIPPNTVCPYKEQCPSAHNGDCGHKGIDHTVAYSCGFARMFEIFSKQ